MQVDTSHDGTAQLNYNSPGYDITNPAAYTIENWFDNYGKQTGGAVDWRADVVYTAPSDEFIREISAGVRYADRSAESNQSYGGAAYPFTHTSVSTLPGLNGVSEPMAGGGLDYVTTQWYTPSASYLLNNTDKVRAQTALLYDRNATSAAIFALRNDPVTGKRRIDPGMYFSDVEKTYAGYVQSKIGGDLGATPWSGVVGLRLVRTEQTLGGNNVDTASPLLRLHADHQEELVGRPAAQREPEVRPAAGPGGPPGAGPHRHPPRLRPAQSGRLAVDGGLEHHLPLGRGRQSEPQAGDVRQPGRVAGMVLLGRRLPDGGLLPPQHRRLCGNHLGQRGDQRHDLHHDPAQQLREGQAGRRRGGLPAVPRLPAGRAGRPGAAGQRHLHGRGRWRTPSPA